MVPLRAILVIIVTIALSAPVVDGDSSTHGELSSSLVTGNLEIWDRIFASRSHQVLLDGPANNLSWTEGPIIVGNDLIFSDTIESKIYSLDLHSVLGQGNIDDDGNVDSTLQSLRIVKERSGGSSPEDDDWRAEPGSNGLVLFPSMHDVDKSPKSVLVCQHGARQLAALNINTRKMLPLATEYGGERLNGPNDVCIREEEDVEEGNRVVRTYAYFTDPVYAWLEQGRFEDLPYLDDKVQMEGPGHCGVYRVEIDESEGNAIRKGNVELISSALSRPNGIGFDGDDLIISDCCQGSHLEGCTSGISRWVIFRKQVGEDLAADSTSWIHSATIEDVVSAEDAAGGCADGFALYDFDDESSTYGRRKRRGKHALIASCYGGLCVVDLEAGEVVARMWTAKKEHGGCKVSNTAVGTNHVYLTGNCGILMLPLRQQNQSNDRYPYPEDQERMRGEL